MSAKSKVLEILSSWGFPVIEESESSVVLRFQMNYVSIGSMRDDSNFVSVTLSGIFHADNDEETFLALRGANDLAYRQMIVKAYLDSDLDLVIAVEFFYPEEEHLEGLLEMALKAVVHGKKTFLDTYRSLEAQQKLLREAEEE